MRNPWIESYLDKKWMINISGTDSNGDYRIFGEPFEKDFEWESPIEIDLEHIEVVNGNGFVVWFQDLFGLPTLAAGDIFKIDFGFEPWRHLLGSVTSP